MSVIEIIEFSTRPGTNIQSLQHALNSLDQELASIGGFRSRDLYRTAGTENGWMLDYRWSTLADAQNSMNKVASTQAFTHLMELVEAPEKMRMTYGEPV